MIITGFKKSGKTSLIEDLIAALKKRGHKVGVIKHTLRAHSLDTPGKDTWRYKKAGACVSALLTPTESGIFLDHSLQLGDTIAFLRSCDIVLLEGFKELEIAPRIIVAQEADDIVKLRNGLEVAVIRKFRSGNLEDPQVPVLDSSALNELADIVETKAMPLLAGRDCGKCGYSSCKDLAKAVLVGDADATRCVNMSSEEVRVFLDGAQLDINPFVGSVIRNVIMGVLSALKGVGNQETVEVQFNVERAPSKEGEKP